jgi:hypothetical protein
MDIDLIKKQMKEKRKNTYLSNASFSIKSNPYLSNASSSIKSNPKLFSFILRIMILTIIFLGSLIYTKLSVSNKQSFYDVVFKDNLSFAVINNFYNKYLGGILPFKDIIKDNKPVFKEKLTYREANIYKDGVSLSVDKE